MRHVEVHLVDFYFQEQHAISRGQSSEIAWTKTLSISFNVAGELRKENNFKRYDIIYAYYKFSL